MPQKRRFLVASCALVVAACQGTTDVVCTTVVEPGIVVRIEDSVSGELRAAAAAALALAPGYSDSLRPYESEGNGELVSRAGAYERPGIYVVSLEEAGYRPWRAAQIWVLPGRCHVMTVRLVARLQPAP
jgi:hypothetical protein